MANNPNNHNNNENDEDGDGAAHKLPEWINAKTLLCMLANDLHHQPMATLRTTLNQSLLEALEAATHPQQPMDDVQRRCVESIAVLYGLTNFADNAFRTNELPVPMRQALMAVGCIGAHDSLPFTNRIRHHLHHGQLVMGLFGMWHVYPLETRVTVLLSSLELAIGAVPGASRLNWELQGE